MATKKLSDFQTTLQAHGHSVKGLLLAVRAETTAQAEAVADLTPEKAYVVMAKAMVSEGFFFSRVSEKQPVIVKEGEESAVAGVLAGLGADAKKTAVAHWLNEAVPKFKSKLPDLRRFNSRVANTATAISVNDAPRPDEPLLPYLYSKTVSDPVGTLHAGGIAVDPHYIRALAAIFRYKGRLTCLAAEIADRASTFLQDAGMNEAGVQELRAEVNAPASAIDHRLPTVLWPQDTDQAGYVALTPIPSLVVLDELDARHKVLKFVPHEKRTSFLSTSVLDVGGGNPQNAGLFNLMANGQHYLYRSKLHVRHQTREQRRLWSTNWLNRVSVPLANRINAFPSVANAAAQRTFFDNCARLAIAEVLSYAARASADAQSLRLTLSEDALAKFDSRLAANTSYRYLSERAPEDAVLLAGEIISKAATAGADILRRDEQVLTKLRNALVAQLDELDTDAI